MGQFIAKWKQGDENIGLPPETEVGFVTGATMANFTCLAAARQNVLKQAGWNVEADGLFGAPEVTVVVGEEAHPTLFKALGLAGFGRNRVVRIPAEGLSASGYTILNEVVLNQVPVSFGDAERTRRVIAGMMSGVGYPGKSLCAGESGPVFGLNGRVLISGCTISYSVITPSSKLCVYFLLVDAPAPKIFRTKF